MGDCVPESLLPSLSDFLNEVCHLLVNGAGWNRMIFCIILLHESDSKFKILAFLFSFRFDTLNSRETPYPLKIKLIVNLWFAK